MSKPIEIPYDVWYAINHHPKGFDEMYYSNLSKSKGSKEAFFKTINRINDYFPDLTIYTSFISYQITLNKRMRKKENRV